MQVIRLPLWLLAGILVVGCLAAVAYGNSPSDLQKLIHQAYQAASTGNFKEAEKQYQAVLREDPEQAYATLGLAAVLQAEKRSTEAEKTLTDLIARHPDFQPAYYLLGVIYESRGDLVKARDAYHTYVSIAPENVPPNPEVRIKLRQAGVF